VRREQHVFAGSSRRARGAIVDVDVGELQRT
jgi:hypothetical protein